MAITPVGFEGQVNEQPFAKMMSAVGGYGILGTVGGTNFAAARVAGSRTVTVQPGDLWAPGVHVTMDSVTTPTAVAANSTGSNRIDLLVMRVNWTAAHPHLRTTSTQARRMTCRCTGCCSRLGRLTTPL
jgi:hypothetical protein